MRRAAIVLVLATATAALAQGPAPAPAAGAAGGGTPAKAAAGRRAVERAPATKPQGPVSTRAEKDGVTVERTLAAKGPWQPGTPIEWTLKATLPEGWTAQPSPLGETLGAFDVRDARIDVSAQERTATQRATLYAWQSGSVEVPAAKLAATGPGGARTEITVPAATVELTSLLGDGIPLTELASDIRGPVDVGGRAWWWWALAGVAAVGALGFVWWLRSRRAAVPEAPPLPPAEWAMRELDRLERDRLAERGEVDGFFVRLSDVVRTYVERRFAIAAPDRTTQEFLREAAHHPDLRGEHERTLGAFLRSADMVKFAAARPGTETCTQALAAMRGFVERTAPAPEAAAGTEPPVAATAAHGTGNEPPRASGPEARP
jgi:hypothetical protein